MKIKFKLSLLMIGIMAVVIAGLCTIMLKQASDTSIGLSTKAIQYLLDEQTQYWKGREDGFLRVLRTLSYVMEDYENFPADRRRDQFDDLLFSTMTSEPAMIVMYTVWKPDAVDGMDRNFLNRPGSCPVTGQYISAFTRETGEITQRITSDVENTMRYITGTNSRKDRIDNPVLYVIEGVETYVFRMMVPIINPRTNEVVGGIGCMVTIEAMQITLEENMMDHDEISAMAIYSGDGRVIASYQPLQVGQMMNEVASIYGDYSQEAHQAVLNGENFECRSFSPVLDTDVIVLMTSFEIGNSGTTWSIMIATEEDYVLKEVHQITQFTIILAIIAILISAIIVFIVLGIITQPIVKVTETLKDISEGEGDLTRTIKIKGNDEVADLSRYFNRTLEKIKILIITIKQKATALSDIGSDLASNMTETAAAINQITANIQSIKERVLNQSASVSQTNSTMEQITSNINTLNEHVDKQSSSVTKSSSAIEQMLANINSVTQTLVRNSESVSELLSASEIGRTGLQTVAHDIQEISRESEGLMEINSVMNNIASQTNLLSMNAAIEAAHAGDAGKGFAVVADEIRKLAESSGDQSKTIGNVLKKIKDSIDKITVSTSNVINKFEAIDSGVKVVSDQETTIRNAMEEQSEGSRQILDAVSQLNNITQNVKSETTEMMVGSKEVIHESKHLEDVTQEITGGMNEMAAGAQQINEAVTSVNQITEKNKENIEILVEEVSRFIVE